MKKNISPKELNLHELLAIENLTKKDLHKSLADVFTMIEKKPYQNYQDKKTTELIGLMLTYFESVKYTQDKMINDLRFAWDSYQIKEQQEAMQFESFKKWYTKNKQTK